MLNFNGNGWNIKELQKNEWEDLWNLCTKNNLLQSWEYGNSKKQSEGWEPIRLLVSDEKNNPIGIAQVLVKRIFFLGGLVP